MPLSTNTPTHILVIRSGAVGDFVLTTPVIASLRKAYPRSRITVVGNPARSALANHLIDAIIDFDTTMWSSLFVQEGSPSQDLKDLLIQTDLIVSYVPDPDRIFSDNLGRLTSGHVLSQSPHPPQDGSVHIVDHLLGVLQPLQIRTVRQPTVATQSPPTENPPHFVLHPGSGGGHKVWPLERFAKIAEALSESGEVSGTSGPADASIVNELKSQVPSIRAVPQLSLPQLAGYYQSAKLFIGNDSGPTHLAAAVGTPTIAIFGPTDPRTWGPLGKRVEHVSADGSLPTEQRLASIGVDRVLECANRLISL
jgi:ADP-heptose:LPS heptosyltransferase